MKINIGSKIYALRRKSNLTQEQLAVEVGVSSAAVSKWETQNVIPDIDILCTLADYFQTSVDELIGRQPVSTDILHNDSFINALETVKQILKLTETAREKGLLAWEEAVKDKKIFSNDFLRFIAPYLSKMICMDKIDHDTAYSLANNYVNSMPENEKLAGRIAVEGCIMIIRGHNSKYIGESLASFLGYENRELFFNYINVNEFNLEDEYNLKLKEFQKENQNKQVYSEKTGLLEELTDADNLLIQLMLRYLDSRDVIAVMKASSIKVSNKILLNLSKRLAVFLLTDYKNTDIVEDEMIRVQQKVLEIINNIRDKIK